MKTVFVGLSGGVDSSVSALLLKQQGYRVVGVYMKNWTKDIGGTVCLWREDYLAAKQLATHLEIEFRVFDFQKAYHKRVVEAMLKQYQLGHTPNPDITCNQEIKFKLFLETAFNEGADLIATGHYARIRTNKLLRARDDFKDQTYFLYRLNGSDLKRVLFPVGEYLKSEVRQLALTNKLPTAKRAESMGICFVGQVGIRQFLSQYLECQPGPIVDQTGEIVGQHDGALFYTIGQRQGLGVGGGLPYYVTGKDMAKNEVYVTRDLDSPLLWAKELSLLSLHWLNQPPKPTKTYHLRARHQAELIASKLKFSAKDSLKLKLSKSLRAPASGQSAVIYDGQLVVGGGIIS